MTKRNKEKQKEQSKQKFLFRSNTDFMFAGVLGGLASYWNMDSTILRLLFLALTVLTAGLALVVYFILTKIIPKAPEYQQ